MFSLFNRDLYRDRLGENTLQTPLGAPFSVNGSPCLEGDQTRDASTRRAKALESHMLIVQIKAENCSSFCRSIAIFKCYIKYEKQGSFNLHLLLFLIELPLQSLNFY